MTDKADSEFSTIRNAMNNKFIEYVCQWRKEHPDEYEEFRNGVSAVSAGDTSTFEKLFEVIMTCIPHAVINECMAFFGVQSATDSSISKLASDSIRQGYDRKADWENDFDDVEDPDVRREVMRSIAETPGRKGRPHLEQKEYSIDDCLIAKDKEALKEQILAVLGEMQHDYDLAFIREALRCSNHLADISYPFFHHAICVFSGMEFKYDRVQRMSTLIEFRNAEFVASHDPRNLRGKRMIRLWADMFSEVE